MANAIQNKQFVFGAETTDATVGMYVVIIPNLVNNNVLDMIGSITEIKDKERTDLPLSVKSFNPARQKDSSYTGGELLMLTTEQLIEVASAAETDKTAAKQQLIELLPGMPRVIVPDMEAVWENDVLDTSNGQALVDLTDEEIEARRFAQDDPYDGVPVELIAPVTVVQTAKPVNQLAFDGDEEDIPAPVVRKAPINITVNWTEVYLGCSVLLFSPFGSQQSFTKANICTKINGTVYYQGRLNDSMKVKGTLHPRFDCSFPNVDKMGMAASIVKQLFAAGKIVTVDDGDQMRSYVRKIEGPAK
jgi:hypothetical protein